MLGKTGMPSLPKIPKIPKRCVSYKSLFFIDVPRLKYLSVTFVLFRDACPRCVDMSSTRQVRYEDVFVFEEVCPIAVDTPSSKKVHLEEHVFQEFGPVGFAMCPLG